MKKYNFLFALLLILVSMVANAQNNSEFSRKVRPLPTAKCGELEFDYWGGNKNANSGSQSKIISGVNTTITLNQNSSIYDYYTPGNVTKCPATGNYNPKYSTNIGDSGKNGVAKVTFSFDKPVNDVMLFFANIEGNERATISVNSGILTLSNIVNCNASVSGNQIIKTSSGAQNSATIQVLVRSTTPYTSITIDATGDFRFPDGYAGIDVAICELSVKPSTNPFDCTDNIYSLSSSTDATNGGKIRAFNDASTSGALGSIINTLNHSAFGATTGPNALGYSKTTGKFYYMHKFGATYADNSTFVSYDPVTGTYETLAGTPEYFYRGTVTNDGLGYYAISSINTLKYYDITANTWTTITQNYVDQNGNSLNALLNENGGGDIAMDGNGNLWILAGGKGGSSIAYVFKVKSNVPKTNMGATALVLEQIVKQDIGGLNPNGIAFGSSGEIFITNGTDLFRMNPDFTISGIGTVSPSGTTGDLTSCAYPTDVFKLADFGDAPDTYKTLLSSDGPRHTPSQFDATTNTATLMIGDKIDLEFDGLPNANADGDDTNNIDDETSGIFLPLNTTATSYTVTVPVVNTTGLNATLRGWIDFNKNGVFDDSEATSVTVPNGATSVNLTWTGLSGLSVGDTYYRLRIAKNDADILLPTGAVFGGEVEDGKLSITQKFCTKPGLTGTPAGYTKVGITVQQKQAAWPENIPNGWIALESKEKGMVITRVQNTDTIIDAIEGMLVYDIEAQCVKLYNGSTWKCLEKSCNE